ncbi:MAG: hypothetical protein ACI94O_001881 [Octadecabacter sp.]|jgi:hypothetical protein
MNETNEKHNAAKLRIESSSKETPTLFECFTTITRTAMCDIYFGGYQKNLWQ